MIVIPRALLVALAAVFSTFHLVLGVSGLYRVSSWPPVVLALVLYALATVVSLWSTRERMPLWMACVNLAVCVAVPVLVTGQLDPTVDNGYATWHVGALGTLATITAVRGRELPAWLGVGFLVAQSLVWMGPSAVVRLGILGGVVWVAIAVLSARALLRVRADLQRYTVSEQEAILWQAAQEAHVVERELRLRHTHRLAAPTLTRLAEGGTAIGEAERARLMALEAAIRDEIRGRRLLNDEVRAAVMAARGSGVEVSLLDDGGLETLGADGLRAVLDRVAEAIRVASSPRLIVRTVPHVTSATAVTVVGLHPDPSDGAGGHHDGELDLFLEIPRPTGS